MHDRQDRVHAARAVADHLEALARRVREGDVLALDLRWDGARDYDGTLRKADGRDVAFDMVLGEATVLPLG